MVLGNCFFRRELLESLLDSTTVEDAQFTSESRARPRLFGGIGANHEGKKFILIPDSLSLVFEAKTFL